MFSILRMIRSLFPWKAKGTPRQNPKETVEQESPPNRKAQGIGRPSRHHGPVSLDRLLEMYNDAKDQHGCVVDTINGLVSVGDSWIFYKARDHFGLCWSEFRGMAASVAPPKSPPPPLSPDRAKATFARVEAKEGRNAHDAEWLSSNGFACLVNLVTNQLGTNWEEFLSACGITTSPCSQKDDSVAIPIVQTEKEFDTERLRLGKGTMTRAEDIHRVHANVLAMSGPEKALNTGFLSTKGSSDIYNSANRLLGLNWSPYLLTFGAYLAANQPRLLPDGQNGTVRPSLALPSPPKSVCPPNRESLGKRSVSCLGDIAEVHAQVLAKHGMEAALGTGRLNENGYSDIRSSAYGVFGFNWNTYLVWFGAYLSKYHPDLLPKVSSCTDEQRSVPLGGTIKRSA